MIIAFGLRQTKRGKQKSHKLLPGVNSPGIFLPGIEPEQLFVFCFCSRLAHEKRPNQEHLKREIGVLRGKQILPIDAID